MSDELVRDHLTHLTDHLGSPPATVDSRRSALGLLAEWLPYGLAYATTETITAWLNHLRDQRRSQATQAIYGYHVTSFYKWATDPPACCDSVDLILDGDPAIGVPWPKRPVGLPRPVREEELAELLALPEPLFTIVVLGAFEGMRRAEIAAADREHLGPMLLEIPRRKGGRTGSVPTHPQVWEWLRDRPAGPLVRNHRGQRLTPQAITALWWRTVQDLQLPRRLTPHMLRHRYGTCVHAETGDLLATRDALGQSSARSTEVYALVASPKVAAAVASLPVPRIITQR